MIELDQNYIPLSLEMNDNIISYIIDNQLIGSQRGGSSLHNPFSAFRLVCKLYKNEITRKVIPKPLQEILAVDFELPKYGSQELLIGAKVDRMYKYGLSLDMRVIADSTSPIELFNIRYYHGNNLILLPHSLSLTASQAFHLFANILANDRCIVFADYFYGADLLVSKIDPAIKTVLQREDSNIVLYGKAFKLLTQFSFTYLHYLSEELTKNTLHPSSILQLSGATTLAYLRQLPEIDKYLKSIVKSLQKPTNLSTNEQILYYTLLYSSIESYVPDDKIHHYFEDYTDNLKSYYDTNLTKEFPISDKMANL